MLKKQVIVGFVIENGDGARFVCAKCAANEPMGSFEVTTSGERVAYREVRSGQGGHACTECGMAKPEPGAVDVFLGAIERSLSIRPSRARTVKPRALAALAS